MQGETVWNTSISVESSFFMMSFMYIVDMAAFWFELETTVSPRQYCRSLAITRLSVWTYVGALTYLNEPKAEIYNIQKFSWKNERKKNGRRKSPGILPPQKLGSSA